MSLQCLFTSAVKDLSFLQKDMIICIITCEKYKGNNVQVKPLKNYTCKPKAFRILFHRLTTLFRT